MIKIDTEIFSDKKHLYGGKKKILPIIQVFLVKDDSEYRCP